MQQLHFKRNHSTQLADIDTPISIYLKLRDHFDRVVLLESNDFHSADNSHSYICCGSLCSIRVIREVLTVDIAGERVVKQCEAGAVVQEIKDITGLISYSGAENLTFAASGFFGFFGYDAVRYMEDIEVAVNPGIDIPDIALDFFRYVIVFDHYRQAIHLVEHQPEGAESGMSHIKRLIRRADILQTPFELTGDLRSNMSDDTYREHVRQGIEHCQQGDVFQVVLSRAFQQDYRGDVFNVYRALRMINPSPYLFYFDYGGYKLFGSSPEAQLTVGGGKARINPIAGTYPRSGDPEEDERAAARLLADEKELSEHTMLVDLARNDLNRRARNVRVEAYREIHQYSHVIHMVSEVCGDIDPKTHVLDVLADSFPAGTLSGAPKYRAMEIIRNLEPTARRYYGGAIGLFDAEQSMNMAIMIRTILSRGNTLHFQAGAGIVVSSDPERETAEVKHKIQALIKAITSASKTPAHAIALA